MADISFLPSSYKEQEDEIKKESLKTASNEPVSMHVPEAEEEDVEIIEVDASEVDQILLGEPIYTRLYYRASLFVDNLKTKYLEPRSLEPPPKTPPQFFKTPQKTESASGAQAQPLAQGAPQATPAVPGADKKTVGARSRSAVIRPSTGKRVRIIKRVRKPLEVSLLDEGMMRDLHINIPKRKFTLIFLTFLFGVVFTGAFLLFDNAIVRAVSDQAEAQNILNQTNKNISEEQAKWKSFQDLEPRLLALSALLETHVSVNRVLAFLEEITLQDVSYGSFMMSEDGRINLSVTAVSFEAAAAQLLAYETSPHVASVEANAFSLSDNMGIKRVTFQLVLQFKPDSLRFYKPNSNGNNTQALNQ
jgi:hypothetical protein